MFWKSGGLHEDLFDAIRRGDTDGIQALLDSNPALVASANDRGMTPITMATYIGDDDPLEERIMTPTDQASPELIADLVGNAHGNLARVEEIIGSHPDLINASAPWVETPIQAATHMANRPIADYLLAKGANYDIFTAAMYGRLDDVASFLAEDPQLISAHGVHDMAILYFPAVSGDVATLRFLLERGADVNDGAGGHTPLHGAVQFAHLDSVRFLLDHGADPSALNFEHKTPLQIAEDRGHTEIADLLHGYAG